MTMMISAAFAQATTVIPCDDVNMDGSVYRIGTVAVMENCTGVELVMRNITGVDLTVRNVSVLSVFFEGAYVVHTTVSIGWI